MSKSAKLDCVEVEGKEDLGFCNGFSVRYCKDGISRYVYTGEDRKVVVFDMSIFQDYRRLYGDKKVVKEVYHRCRENGMPDKLKGVEARFKGFFKTE